MRCVDSVVELAASDHFHQLSIKANPTSMHTRMHSREFHQEQMNTDFEERDCRHTNTQKDPPGIATAMQSLFRLPIASLARMTGQPALFTSGIDMESVWFVAF